MKKVIAFALALMMIFALCACGPVTGPGPAQNANVDLAAFYETMFADAKADGLMMERLEGDMLEMFYPGLSAVECKQLVVYAPPMTAVAYEAALIEVANSSDVETVKGILQARVDSQSTEGPGMYPETVEQWQKNSAIVTNGNYLMLVVGEGAAHEVEAFNALFAG